MSSDNPKNYFKLINIQIPTDDWIFYAKMQKHRGTGRGARYTDTEILADSDDPVDLRNFLGCIIEYIMHGYRYYIDFILWSPKIDLFPFLAKKGYHIKYDTPAKDQTNGDTQAPDN